MVNRQEQHQFATSIDMYNRVQPTQAQTSSAAICPKHAMAQTKRNLAQNVEHYLICWQWLFP